MQRIYCKCKRFALENGHGNLAPFGILAALKKAMAALRGRHMALIPQIYLQEYKQETQDESWLLFVQQRPNEASIVLDQLKSGHFLTFCIWRIKTMMNSPTPPLQFTSDQWKLHMDHIYAVVQAKLESSQVLPTPTNPEINQ
jgi:hypothetical protein